MRSLERVHDRKQLLEFLDWVPAIASAAISRQDDEEVQKNFRHIRLRGTKDRDCCLKPFRDRRADNVALLETAGGVECRAQLGWCSRRRIWSKQMHVLGSTQATIMSQSFVVSNDSSIRDHGRLISSRSIVFH